MEEKGTQRFGIVVAYIYMCVCTRELGCDWRVCNMRNVLNEQRLYHTSLAAFFFFLVCVRVI